MALDALLFDIDGTLLDTNDAHVDAWLESFARFGYRIARDRIEVEVGKGGDKLVPAILGEGADAEHGDALRKNQPAAFKRIATERGIRPFPGALALLRAARDAGLKVALATSSQKEHLRTLRDASGIDVTESCDLLVTADDAAESKPAPDIVAAAVRKLRMTPAQCALVGDTLYDMQSARRAGVIGLGVLTGYQSRETLLRSGARAVWDDSQALLAQLDAALRIASPASVRLTRPVLEALMREALAEARLGLASGETPIGCVIADGAGQIVARGHNEFGKSGDRTAHAELVAFRRAAGRIPTGSKDHILVSTLEPCVMCTGAAMEAAMDTILYALRAPADSGTGRVEPPQSPESQMPRIVGGILAKESRALFEEFGRIAQNPVQRDFVAQLLKLTANDPDV